MQKGFHPWPVNPDDDVWDNPVLPAEFRAEGCISLYGSVEHIQVPVLLEQRYAEAVLDDPVSMRIQIRQCSEEIIPNGLLQRSSHGCPPWHNVPDTERQQDMLTNCHAHGIVRVGIVGCVEGSSAGAKGTPGK